MTQVLLKDNVAVAVVHIYSDDTESHHDWKSFDRVTEIASQLTVETGEFYIPTDAGSSCSSRYNVRKMYSIGDAVSKYFNGDSYPCGYIVSISKTLRKITTSTGVSFSRRKETGSWVSGNTWFLSTGHISEQNPSF